MSVTSFVQQCTDYVHSLLGWTAPINGNADQWAASAAQQGFPESHTPAAGDVVEWGANQLGASSVGHVAAVTAVLPNGSVQIAQSNWPENTGPSAATLAPSVADQLTYIAPKGSQTLANNGPAVLTSGTPLSGIAAIPGDVANALWGPITQGAMGADQATNAAGAVAGWSGQLAGQVAGGVVAGVATGVGTVAGDTVVPWFKANAVALVTAAIIVMILFSGKGSGSSSQQSDAGTPSGSGGGGGTTVVVDEAPAPKKSHPIRKAVETTAAVAAVAA
jgi:CHAP domain